MQGSNTKNATSCRPTEIRSAYRNDLGHIFRDYTEHYIRNYSPSLHVIKLLRAIRICKSPGLGGKTIVCKSCDHHHYIYNSCGHSHCPLCQTIKREQWVDKLKSRLLKVPYVHMVFTLPRELHSLARKNKEKIYDLILRASWLTVKQVAADPKNIGALPGMVSVLHTFGSDMKYHIHTHCLVTFGGVDRNNAWKYPHRKDKIASYRKINGTYKEIFINELCSLYNKGLIRYDKEFPKLMEMLRSKKWVVHNTKPHIDTSILENYLARYINRVAISKSRVEYLEKTKEVRILYNDYVNQKNGEAAPKKHKRLDTLSFIHQFCQHILPPYFHKTRRYGLHSSATSKKYKDLLPKAIRSNSYTVRTVMQIIKQLIGDDPFVCERCGAQDYEIKLVYKDKEWIQRYITVPTSRSPPIKSQI